jgi:hypothetical protein
MAFPSFRLLFAVTVAALFVSAKKKGGGSSNRRP